MICWPIEEAFELGFLKKLFTRKNGKRDKKMIVLGLDGVPYSFMKRMTANSNLPVFKSLLAEGEFKRINSVLPTVSSVAWSSFMTGQDASGHNIFGFVDRKPSPFKLFIPTADIREGETIWDKLAQLNKESIIINVPVTYPPAEIEGIMISGFLATDLSKATYPVEIATELEGMDYVIDVDTWIARDSREDFLVSLNYALERRFKTMFKFLEEKSWNYLQCHIMETDRINHFFWRDMENADPRFEELFLQFYKKIDDYLGELLKKIDNSIDLIILSDHGFCSTKKEVELNYWLEEEGYLKYNIDEPESIEDMASASKAYSLLPGRIFINCRGRESNGRVTKKEYDTLRRELKSGLLKLKDEETGDMIIKNVYYREELYDGPYLERAADLIAVPHRGYDLKGNVNQGNLLQEGFIQGMHTYDDAFIYFRDQGKEDKLAKVNGIQDVKSFIIDQFKEQDQKY